MVSQAFLVYLTLTAVQISSQILCGRLLHWHLSDVFLIIRVEVGALGKRFMRGNASLIKCHFVFSFSFVCRRGEHVGVNIEE